MKKFRSLALGLIVMVLSGSSAINAQERGENIFTDTGVVSNMIGDVPSVKYVTVEPPRLGGDYEVKVNFLKVETSASIVDDFIDQLNEQARAEGREQESERWDALREELKGAESKADYEVFDANGRSVGKASNLGALTFLKTVRFTAETSSYKIRIRCSSGAGLYHLTFEYD